MIRRNKQRATWLYKEDLDELRKYKGVRDGKLESDAEAFRKIIRKAEKDDEDEIIKMDKRRRAFI